MPDILIIRRRDRGFIFAESEVGKVWLRNNLEFSQEDDISMDFDLVEDIIALMQNEDLIVEVK